VFVSAVAEDGLEPLRRSLLGSLRAQRPLIELRLPAHDGKAIAEIHRDGEVIEQRVDGDEIVIAARLAPELAARLQSRNHGAVAP